MDLNTPLSQQITACLAEIARLEGERERCNTAITEGTRHASALEELRRLRAGEAAAAFVEQRAAKVAPFDKEIAGAEKLHASSIAQADIARDGLQIIKQRLTEARAELAAARASLKALISDEVKARGTRAREIFNSAANDLLGKLAAVSALDSMDASLRGVASRFSASQLMIDALKDEGLKVFTTRGVGTPGWLHTFSATAYYEQLVAEFREIGLDI